MSFLVFFVFFFTASSSAGEVLLSLQGPWLSSPATPPSPLGLQMRGVLGLLLHPALRKDESSPARRSQQLCLARLGCRSSVTGSNGAGGGWCLQGLLFQHCSADVKTVPSLPSSS